MAGDDDVGLAGGINGGHHGGGDGEGLIKKPGQQQSGETNHQCFYTPVAFDGSTFGVVAMPPAVFCSHINDEKKNEEEDAGGGYIELVKKPVDVFGLERLGVFNGLQEYKIWYNWIWQTEIRMDL